jgi:hypothetical protein
MPEFPVEVGRGCGKPAFVFATPFSTQITTKCSLALVLGAQCPSIRAIAVPINIKPSFDPFL